jgi:hypothetical protein
MQQQHTAPTPTGTPTKRPEWQVWIEVFSPHVRNMRADLVPPAMMVASVPWPPTHRDIDRAGEWALAQVPEDFDLGTDEDGCPIIAYEALCDVLVRDPHGWWRIAPCENNIFRWAVFGWQTLVEYEERQRNGEGVVEERHYHRAHLLKMWVWNEGA